MKHFRIMLLAIASVLVVGGWGLNLNAQAAQSHNDLEQKGGEAEITPIDTGEEPETSEKEQAEALAFWTREEMMKAEPIVMIDFSSPNEFITEPESDMASNEPSIAVDSALPDASAEQFAREFYAEEWALLESDTNSFSGNYNAPMGASQVHTSYTLSASGLNSMASHRWMGRFTSTGGTCSATAIRNNQIVTAAHCVYNTTNNTWNQSKVFAPAYRNGSRPYGSFATTQCKIPVGYVNLTGSYTMSWARYDVAVCKVGTNSAGQTLNTAVGWAGFTTNASSIRHVFNTGFPGRDYRNLAISDGSQYLRACVAETAYYTTDTHRMGCFWGPGISGGSWLTSYGTGTWSGQVTGVNSGMFFNTQNMYGPNLTSGNWGAICTTGWC